MSAERPAGSRLKTYSDRKYLHTTLVRHQGTTVSLALDEDRRIFYSVLDFDAAVTAPKDGDEESRADLDVHHWSEDPKELAFPREITRAGYALLGADEVPRVRRGGRAEEGPEDVFREEEIDPFLSGTARLTAAVPFQAVSDGRHIFVFRQAVDAGHADALVWDEDGQLTGNGATGTAVADGALLCDRFVLAGGELRPVLEVRYRRSRHRTQPESAKDSLGIKDMDEKPFHEPTLELAFAGRPREGRFSVLLLPTGVTGVSRWQFFVHGKASGAVESINVEQGEDGLFNTQGSRLWTSPDPAYRPSVLEREPGLCPFTKAPLVPVEPEAAYAESALSLPGGTGKGYGEAAAPSGLGATAYTVEAWIKPQAAGGTVLSTGATGVGLSVTDKGALVLAHDTATLSTAEGLVKAGDYTHVAAVYDGSAASLLVDGESVTSGTLAAATAPGAAGKLLLGARTATTGHFAGVLDEVRLWARARRSARIAATRGERLVGDEPQLVAYYRCDEGTGTTAYDQSANSAHAALRGTVAWVTSDAPVADHPGIRRDVFRATGYQVTGGLSAVLLHQQEEGTVGGGEIRPLKRQARVLLTWAATATGATTGRIAALDLAVGRDGRLAQLPDVLTLPVVGSAVPTADPARENALATAIAADTEAVAAVRVQQQKLLSDARGRRGLTEELAKARRKCTSALFRADLGTTPVVCEIYTTDGKRLVVEKDGKGVYRPALTSAVPKAGDKTAQWTVNGATFKNLQTGTFLTDQGTDKALVLGSSSSLTLWREGGSPFPRDYRRPGSAQEDDGSSVCFHAPGKYGCVTVDLKNGVRWVDTANLLRFQLVPVKPTGDAVLKAVADIATVAARIRAVENYTTTQKAFNEEITRLTSSIRSNEEELGRITAYTKGRSIHTEPMKRLGQDRLGLGYSGAVLDFAAAKGSPFLAESGTGHLGLYYRDDQDRLTGLFYDTNVDRSTKTVTAADSTEVLLTTRDAGVDLADVTVTVAAGSVAGRCTLTLAVQDGDTETWAELPRDAEQFAAALNGVREAPVAVATTASFKDGVLTLAAPGTARALEAGALLDVGGSVYVLSAAVEKAATELRLVYGSRTATIAAGTSVNLLSYTPALVTHTRPGAAAQYGSRYVSASVVSEVGSTIGAVADGAATTTGAVRLPRWWADLPGRALTFAATTEPPALPAAKLSQARQSDDLTIEAWLKPAAGSTAEDTRRILHANTGTAALDSQYVLALGGTTTKTTAGERPLVVGVGNRFVTSKATVPADKWTHVAAAFEQSWALRFADGVYAQAPHADDLNVGRDLTLEVFLQTDALGKAQGVLAKGRTGDGRGRRVPYQLGIGTDGKLVFTFEDRDGNEVRYSSTGAVRAGTFHRIAVVRKLGDSREEKKGTKQLSVLDAAGKATSITVDAIESLVVSRWSDLTFYIDGAEAGKVRHNDAADLGTPGPLDIGRARRGTATEEFTGVISEVRVWNTARQLKDLGKDLPVVPERSPADTSVEAQLRPEGLVAHWRFEENEGNAARDESGSHPARLHGPKWTKNPDPKGSRFRLYVDGRLTEATPLTTALAYGSTAQFALGGRTEGSTTTDRYLGVLEEVRLWRTARSEEQILDNLFGRLTGDTADLLGYYPFDDESTDAAATELRDHGPRRLHLPLGTDAAKRPQPGMSTAPISSETPEVRPAFATGQPRYVQTIAGTPAATEYADLQRGRDGVSRGVLKRAYAYLQGGSWNLITGYKLGDLTTEWVGQVQFAPQLVGYIEGAPPVPSENLIATRRPSSLSYINTTQVEFQQADQVVQTLSSGSESTVDTELAFRFSNAADAETLLIAAPLGFGTAKPIVKGGHNVSGGGSFEFSNAWSSQTEVSEGVNTERSTSIGLSGGWETDDPAKQIHAAGGRRFLPANTGYALVQSETADVFALRVAHSAAVVAYRMLPNPDIPRDWNMLPFAINPRYVKQGVLDGMVGYDETVDPTTNKAKGKILDKDYPQAKDYGEYSYFKPREAYALKRRITEAMQRRQAFYAGVSTETAKAGSFPAQERAQKLLDRFTGPVPGNGKEEQTRKQEAEGFARRDLVNTYVWTADGGFFAETTATTDVVTETTAGSYRFHGMAEASFDTSFKVFGIGIGFQLDGALGGGITSTRSRAKEATRSFSLDVKVDTPGDMQRYDEQSNPLFNKDGSPVEVPGRVDAYRFMTFYLDSDKANFEDFYGKVVDPEWLAGSDPNAMALRQADQGEQKPPCWRILHRVTFVSRKLPKVTGEADGPLEQAMRSVDVGSNYELLRRLEPHVDPAVTDRDGLAEQVAAAIELELPGLSAHVETITEYFAAYYGIK